ncbi:MAG: hypothetical protein QOE90_560 [Thermoplasmata archaeon]|jgi:hypothetical protein|nr:hypothetical protein [Thermoplasmata archaeon]
MDEIPERALILRAYVGEADKHEVRVRKHATGRSDG